MSGAAFSSVIIFCSMSIRSSKGGRGDGKREGVGGYLSAVVVIIFGGGGVQTST